MSKDQNEICYGIHRPALNTLWYILRIGNAAVFQTADGTEAAQAITDEWLLVRYGTGSTDMPHDYKLMPTEIFTTRPHYHDDLVSAARLDLDSGLCHETHRG